jgi:predicted XRE-type DNA-binding protein
LKLAHSFGLDGMKREKFYNVWFALEANEANAINMTMRQT